MKSPVANQTALSEGGLRSLEHACKLVALINAQNWKAAQSLLPARDWSLTPLQISYTKQKDWNGIGAYRGTSLLKGGKTYQHRFAYGSSLPANPHEFLVEYHLDGGNFTFAGARVLGW